MIHAALLVLAAVGAPQRALDPIPVERVKIQHEFFVKRLEANTRGTIPHLLERIEATGRVRNFALAAGAAQGEHTGRADDDADVYAVIEAIGWTLASIQSAELAARGDALVDAVVAAQAADGYLYTPVLAKKGERWTDSKSGDELFAAARLIEAGVAYARGTKNTKLLDAAVKCATLLEATFGPGKREVVGARPGIEYALARLHEHTGDARWIALAKAFVDRRGDAKRAERFGETAQDHAPIREQKAVVGDAAGAAILYAGAADVAMQTGDAALLGALANLWTDARARTDVVGTPRFGTGVDACGTRATVAFLRWSERMLVATGEARYADAIETILYNHLPAVTNLAGDEFAETQPLDAGASPRRAPWSEPACAATEVARAWPIVPGLLFAQNGNTLYATQLAGAQVSVVMAGSNVDVRFKSDFPNSGRVEAAVTADQPATWNIKLRKPAWNVDTKVKHDLKEAEHDLYDNEHANGWVPFERKYETTDGLMIHFLAPVRRVSPDGGAGGVAILRGPLVHGLEGVDHGGEARAVFLPAEAELKVENVGTILGGTRAVRARARKLVADGDPKVATMTAIPYWMLGNRAPADLVVWIGTTAEGARAPGG